MTPELMEAGAKALAEHKARASRPGAVLAGWLAKKPISAKAWLCMWMASRSASTVSRR